MLFVTTSCEGFLNITPEGQVSRDELLNTPEGIEDAMYGVYAQLRNNNLYGQEMYFSALEIMAQTFNCTGNEEVTALEKYDYKHSDVQDMFEAIWTEMYKNISNVNSVLTSDLVKDATEYPYTIYRGEALGLRAFMHFDLMRLFCEQITTNASAEGIPYATDFSLITPEFETLQKNYQHVLDDLSEAERLLANEDQYKGERLFMNNREIHFNLYAVQATMARVYLTMGNQEKAYEYAKKVIDNSGRTLTKKENVDGDVAGVLSRTETIFGVYYAGYYSVVNRKLQQTESHVSLDLRKGLSAMYQEDTGGGNDYRSSAYFYPPLGTDEGATLRLSKFTDTYELNGIPTKRPTDLVLGINMIRLPEMYYICAETQLSVDPIAARDYYDDVIENRGLTPLVERTDNTDLTQDRINAERYKEYIGEGQTFFNLKRQNLAINSFDGSTTFQPSKELYVVPIPDIEYENRF